MSMSVRLLQTPDARYVIGAMVSWLVYGALYIAMLNVITHYAAASGISWILSYGVVYAFQKYGTFGAMSREAMLREAGRYVVAVVGLSAAVNFGLVTVLPIRHGTELPRSRLRQLQQLSWRGSFRRAYCVLVPLSKYPPAKPGALGCEPLKAVDPGGLSRASNF